MTTEEKIYHAIELFSRKAPFFEYFIFRFREALTDSGTPAANAERIARVAANSLGAYSGQDYHLGMAQTIASNSEFELAISGNLEAFQSVHRYMSYYLECADMEQRMVAN